MSQTADTDATDHIHVHWNPGQTCRWIDLVSPTAEDFAQVQAEGVCLDDDLLEMLRADRVYPEVHACDGEHLSFVFHAFTLSRAPLLLTASELQLVVGKDYLITIHGADTLPLFAELPRRWEHADADNPLAILFQVIVKGVVNHYNDVLDELQDELGDIEQAVVSDPLGHGQVGQTQATIFRLSKALRTMRKYLGPLRRGIDYICDLTEENAGRMPFPLRHRWAALHDIRLEIEHQIELVDTYRDMVTGVLEAHQATVSNRLADLSNTLNRSMQWLTVAATILTTASVIVGFYGMNLLGLGIASGSPFGAGWVITAVLVVGYLEYLVFKWKKVI
jgi:Mg2+ and Co2+ transporter CorA